MKGISNICDYVAYHGFVLYLLELKTTAGASLPFANIRDNQYEGLLNAMSKCNNVAAGFLIWFYDKDVTYFVPVDVIRDYKNNNKKSIRFDADDLGIVQLKGKKKRTFFTYDMETFFKEMEEFYANK